MLRFRRTRISAAHPVGTFTPFEAMSSALWYSWMFRCLRCTEPPACPETAGNWERAKAIEERTKVVKCQRRRPFAERWTDRKEGFWRSERSRCASLEEKSRGWIQAGFPGVGLPNAAVLSPPHVGALKEAAAFDSPKWTYSTLSTGWLQRCKTPTSAPSGEL